MERIMTTNWNIQTSVGEFVTDNARCAETFEDLFIDFCCGGDNTLANACQEKGLEPEEVLNQLKLLENPVTDQNIDLDQLTPAQLTLHIESKHHEYLKKVLPRISELLDKVLSAHGGRHPELKVLKTTFAHLREDLEPHLLKEERVLFPLIRKLESEKLGTNMQAVAGPIQIMLMEHDRAGDLLKEIRGLTNGFEAPDDGCQSFQLLYKELKFLETDTHLHIHKENNILFLKVNPNICLG
jgi:regulator of cell morphogenesis and NO signaling